MLGWHRTVTATLRRGIEAIQEELRALEQDLGLCAECAGSPPLPLDQRRQQAMRVRTVPRARRRVA
jgi:hypothetical protein